MSEWRNELVQVRVSSAEKEAFEQLAARHGQSVAAYVRNLVARLAAQQEESTAA